MGEVEGGGPGPYLLGGEFSGEEGGEGVDVGEGVGLGKKKGSESEIDQDGGGEVSGMRKGCFTQESLDGLGN